MKKKKKKFPKDGVRTVDIREVAKDRAIFVQIYFLQCLLSCQMSNLILVRNDIVGTTRCGTIRYVEKRYGWCGTLRNEVGGTGLLRFHTVRCDMERR